MIGPFTTSWDPDFPDGGAWLDYRSIDCDFCDAHYQDQIWPDAIIDATEHDGWSYDRAIGLVCCPDCHLRIMGGP